MMKIDFVERKHIAPAFLPIEIGIFGPAAWRVFLDVIQHPELPGNGAIVLQTPVGRDQVNAELLGTLFIEPRFRLQFPSLLTIVPLEKEAEFWRTSLRRVSVQQYNLEEFGVEIPSNLRKYITCELEVVKQESGEYDGLIVDEVFVNSRYESTH